jgi:hypothetical protein
MELISVQSAKRIPSALMLPEYQGSSCSRFLASRKRSRPFSSGTICCAIISIQPGWVKSPVARTSIPLIEAQATRFLGVRFLLVALENLE